MLALAAALVVSSWPGVLKTGDTLPPVALTDQDGARVRVDGFSGQNVLLSFVSTRRASPTFCPAVTAKFLYFQEHMPSVGYRLVQISRDAGADSPQRLQRYAALFGARSADWSFLTGKPGDIARLISSLDAGSAADGYEKLYVVNGRGRILGELPANDWSPADALVWASTLVGTATPRSVTYVGHSSAAMARPYRAALSLEGQSLKRRLDLVEYDSSPNAPFRMYVTDMTKLLHLIVVSDDLQEFQHVHPVLGSDGHFRLPLNFPRSSLYHIYADATPQGRESDVFRFDAPIGDGGHGVRPAAVSSDATRVGPYTVRLSAVRVPSRQDVPLLVAVQRAGLPATDLHPYLGAYAHIVAIGVSDLSYTHVHPTAAGAMTMGESNSMSGSMSAAGVLSENSAVPATMTAHIRFPKPGLYKLWVEFRGGAALFAAPFVISATS